MTSELLQNYQVHLYVCHNIEGEDFSAILQKTVRLNTNTSEIAQTHYQLILEEYDRQTFLYNVEITEVAKRSDSMK